MPRLRSSAALAAMLAAAPVFAQGTPPDLLDMVGAVSGPADATLAERGYRPAGGDANAVYWWNRDGGCVRIAMRKGRFASIDGAVPDACRAAESGRPAPLAGARPERWGGGPATVQVAPPPPGRPGPGNDWRGNDRRLTLVCYDGGGRGYGGDYRWDDSRARFVERPGFSRGVNSTIQVELDGTRGSIAFDDRYARLAGGGGERGWYALSRIERGADGFSARFKTGLWSKASVAYDRATRRIRVRGTTDFSGTCASGDWTRGPGRGRRW